MIMAITVKDIESAIKKLQEPKKEIAYLPLRFYEWLKRPSRNRKEYKQKQKLKKIYIF